MTIIVQVPGVLRTESGNPVQPVLRAVSALGDAVRLVCVGEEQDELFLKREGMRTYANFVAAPLLEVLAKERTSGAVGLVITPDPDDARAIAKQGISVFLCASSSVTNPQWRPERKGWGEIAEAFDG